MLLRPLNVRNPSGGIFKLLVSWTSSLLHSCLIKLMVWIVHDEYCECFEIIYSGLLEASVMVHLRDSSNIQPLLSFIFSASSFSLDPHPFVNHFTQQFNRQIELPEFRLNSFLIASLRRLLLARCKRRTFRTATPNVFGDNYCQGMVIHCEMHLYLPCYCSHWFCDGIITVFCRSRWCWWLCSP